MRAVAKMNTVLLGPSTKASTRRNSRLGRRLETFYISNEICVQCGRSAKPVPLRSAVASSRARHSSRGTLRVGPCAAGVERGVARSA